MQCGELLVDVPGHRVLIRDRVVNLTAKEFQILVCLMQHPGRVFSRESLLGQVWSHEDDVGPRTVDTHMLRLRDKLGQHASHLKTVRGVGYRFMAL